MLHHALYRKIANTYSAHVPTIDEQCAHMTHMSKRKGIAISKGSAKSFHTINNDMGRVTYLRHNRLEVNPHLYNIGQPAFVEIPKDSYDKDEYSFMIRVIERPHLDWATNVQHSFAMLAHHLPRVQHHLATLHAMNTLNDTLVVSYQPNNIYIYHADSYDEDEDPEATAYAAFRDVPIPHESYNALAELMIKAEREEHSDDYPIDGTARMEGIVPNFHFRLHPTDMSHHQRIATLRQCAAFLESITTTTKNGRKRPSRRA